MTSFVCRSPVNAHDRVWKAEKTLKNAARDGVRLVALKFDRELVGTDDVSGVKMLHGYMRTLRVAA